MLTQINLPVYDLATVPRLLGVTLNGVELLEFANPPQALDGFVTFFDPGWSILRMRDVVSGKSRIFYPQDSYDYAPFAKLEEPPRYRQLRVEAVKDSFGKTFAEQQALLLTEEEVPLARVIVMGMVVHFLATANRLFPNCWVRCSDIDSDGRRVYVGCFDSDGFDVHSDWGDGRYGSLGLASSRKF